MYTRRRFGVYTRGRGIERRVKEEERGEKENVSIPLSTRISPDAALLKLASPSSRC